MNAISKLLAVGGLLMSASIAYADEPTKIAFVDTGNTGRSVTAEAIANEFVALKKLHVAIISRAVDMDPFDVAPEANAATLLKQRGIDVSAHRAQQLTANDVRHADVILTMTARHLEKLLAQFPEATAKTYVLGEFATGEAKDVADAYGKPMEVYEAMLEQVAGYIPSAVEKAIARTGKK